jgi:uridine kinase
LFLGLLLLKIFCLCFFSSDFQNKFFIPFVEQFLDHGGNPWQFFYEHPAAGVEFPYSPFMLFIFSAFYAPAHYLSFGSIAIQNFFFKLPLLLMDLGIFFLLLRLPFNKMKALIFYFAAPVVFYATYLHSQLDIIPTGLLFGAVYLLIRGRTVPSALVYGAALATKTHVLVALPILFIYLWRDKGGREALKWSCLSALIACLAIVPFWGPGFVAMVFSNPQQSLLFDAFISIGNGKLYITLLAVVIVLGRFISFRRINRDILYAFLLMVFAALVAFLVPAPGWYVWLFPFISIFFIKADRKEARPLLFWWFNFAYLIYVVLFYDRGLADLIFYHTPLHFKVASVVMQNVSATLLSATLIGCMYIFYKQGIKSNFFYKHEGATVMAIAGDSASGKSTVMQDLKKLFGRKILLLEGDADHKWERTDQMWEQMTHLNPKANDLYRQYEDVLSLKHGRRIYRRDYDHQTGTFSREQRVAGCDYVALSGLHAFYLPKMRKLTDVKIFLDTEDRLRSAWKIARDSKERGHDAQKVAQQISSREADSKKYIQPQREFADLVIGYSLGEAGGDQLQLRIVLDSNIKADDLVAALEKKIDLRWDYSKDLKTQIIEVKGDISIEDVAALADEHISNIDDLLGTGDDVWEAGYRGLVQLFVLLVISETIRTDTGKDHGEI